jgi:hypothetical protein
MQAAWDRLDTSYFGYFDDWAPAPMLGFESLATRRWTITYTQVWRRQDTTWQVLLEKFDVQEVPGE